MTVCHRSTSSGSKRNRSTLLAVGCLCWLPVRSASKCSIYLANSTIPNAGLGIFTTEPVKSGASVGIPDVLLPIHDLKWNHPDYYDDANDDWRFIFSDYVWNGIELGMLRESNEEEITAFAPGFDSAINCHIGLINVDHLTPHFDFENIPHRSYHPSAGSMTPYWNATTIATVDIAAGSELFKNYGDNWFYHRPHEFGRDFPLRKNYAMAQSLLVRFKDIFQQRHNLSHEAMADFYQIMTTSVKSRTLNALPKRFDQVKQAVDKGISSILQPDFSRPNVAASLEARCLDNLEVRPSTVEGAGRGAFASTFFQTGDVITGSPLLLVTDRTFMELYGWDGLGIRNTTKIKGYQLLLNYCFGHPETTVLLCPYGVGVNLINHSRKKANVKAQWSPHGEVKQNDAWLKRTPKNMESEKQSQLGWDYVALGKIQPGEELFLDYGDPWIDAWESHVAKWKPHAHVDYKSAAEWNFLHGDDDIRTEDEQKTNPYPENVQVVCHASILTNTHLLKQKRNSAAEIWPLNVDGVSCEIRRRTIDAAGIPNYTVLVQTRGQPRPIERNRVHRNMLRFRDAYYSTDMHVDGVFRKEATIPDAMLPQAWRNVGQGAAHDEL